MALKKLYDLVSGTLNPSYKTNLQAGGAGVQTTGTTFSPGISSPTLEASVQEVYVGTAPTLITATSKGTPAVAGKLLVLDTSNSAFGAYWTQSNKKLEPRGRGTFGIVTQAGQAADDVIAQSSASGNVCLPGAKALVVTEGPVQAFVNTTVTNTAISAGMGLASDGGGNLTYAGASPSAGTVLAIAADSMAAGISVPVLKNVFVGGF